PVRAGVGHELRDHPCAAVLYRAQGAKPDVQAPSIQVGLRYTVEGSSLQNDMQISPTLLTSEHRPLNVSISDDDNYLGISCSLQLALSAGELRLTSPDPHVHPFLDYRHLTDPFDTERLRQAIRLALRLAAHPALQAVLRDRLSPTVAYLAPYLALA